MPATRVLEPCYWVDRPGPPMLNPKQRSTIITAVCVLLLVLYVVWLADGVMHYRLRGAEKTWLHHPYFGADFWSQPDWAARLYAGGRDPYGPRVNIFHYPPIVIRLFLWSPLFTGHTALAIWTAVNLVTIGAAAWLSSRTRFVLGIEPVRALVAVAAALFSFPAIFELERANFDLITVITLFLALPLMRRHRTVTDVIAGCLLAVGPWVKLYPGLMGLALVALRRWRVLAGFVAMGAVIGLAAPSETMRSFEVLKHEISNVKAVSDADWNNYFVWIHSLSAAWSKLVMSPALPRVLSRVPEMLAAGLAVAPLLVWVCSVVYKSSGREKLAYPLIVWVIAVATFVPQIANDYSLLFLPLCVIAVWSRRDPWPAHVGLGALLSWWQPIALPIPGAVMLVVKLAGLAAAGLCITRRARELAVDQRAEALGPG